MFAGASGYSKHVMHGGAVFLYARAPLAVAYSTYSPYSETDSAGNSTDDEGDGSGGDHSQHAWVLTGLLVASSLPPYAYFGRTLAFRDNIGGCVLVTCAG